MMTPVLEVSGLSFRYESETVLKGISFQVAAGDSVGLVGANGSGKSTLLWCVAGLLHSEGVVRLFGGQPAKACRQRIGMVFQNPEDQLFMPTLAQDLALPLVNHGLCRERGTDGRSRLAGAIWAWPILRSPGHASEPGSAEAGGRRLGNGSET